MYFAFLVLAAAAPASDIQRVDTLQVEEWRVPWGAATRPRDPDVAPDGKVWFVGQQGHYLAYFDPSSGRFERFDLEPGAGPHNQIVDPQGRVWYAGNRVAHIGMFDPATRKIAKFDMPDSTPRDPHTLVFDGRGHIWFTAQQGQHVGRLDMRSGKIDLIFTGANTNPYGIKLDSRGHPWVVLFRTNRILTIDPATLQKREYTLPNERTRPRRLEIGPDDMVWYADYTRGFLGRLDPRTGKVDEFALPGGQNAQPYGTALDDRGRIWISITNDAPGRLVGFDTRTLQVTHVAILKSQQENGKNTIRHMVFHRPTRTVWYATDAGTLGRLRVP
jgi:virginiamycin B lyase